MSEPAIHEESRFEGMRVLLVEDGMVNQRVAAAVLKRLGCEVAIAENGRLAIEAWRADAYAVILMDLQMPEMDGLEATIAIRSEEQATGHHIPIIAMTATTTDIDEECCLKAGMDAYLVKPMRSSEIEEAFQKHVLAAQNRPPVPDASSVETAGESASAGLLSPDNPVKEIPSMLDIETARDRLGGCPDEDLATVAAALKHEAPLRLAELIAAYEEQDLTAIKRSAHTIKGASSVFGAKPVTTPAKAIEETVLTGSLDSIAPLIEELKQTVAQMESQLDEFISKVQGKSNG
ncbi:response regulator [Neorhodopirellula lusitana]|uniref:response regulator n=1 Tax=Neorhodopirellula lusitana TaxID=445327 RepID=UPI00384D8C56